MASRATFTAVRRPLFSTPTTTIVKSPPPTADRPFFSTLTPPFSNVHPPPPFAPFSPPGYSPPNVQIGVKNSQDRVLDEIRSEVRSMRRELDYISIKYSKKEYDDRPPILLSLILLVLIVMTVQGANAQGKLVADSAPADNTADCPSLGDNAQGMSPA